MPDVTNYSVVFATNVAPGHDYTDAANYGPLRPITTGNYPVFKTERLITEIAEAISESFEKDYLLFSGSAFVAGLCLAMWLTRHEQCQALLWDAKQRKYVPRLIKRDLLSLELERAADASRQSGR